MSLFQKYSKAFRYLFFLLLGLLLISIGLPLIYSLTGWVVLIPVSQAFTEGAKDITLLVTGAVIASFVGAFFSAWSHEIELDETRKQIAAGFHQELTTIKTKIQNIDHDDPNRLLVAITKMIPIYPRDSLFFIFRKDLYSLENEIVEPLICLYSKILQLADIQESLKVNKSTGYHSPKQVVDLVNSIKHEIDIIIPLLDERKNKQI